MGSPARRVAASGSSSSRLHGPGTRSLEKRRDLDPKNVRELHERIDRQVFMAVFGPRRPLNADPERLRKRLLRVPGLEPEFPDPVANGGSDRPGILPPHGPRLRPRYLGLPSTYRLKWPSNAERMLSSARLPNTGSPRVVA